jgi:methionine biosynthesis protein MetW
MRSEFPSPDANATGFLDLDLALDPLRYGVDHTGDPDEVAGVISSLVPLGARVLDVGCGTGSLAAVLRNARRAEVVGVEPDSRRAAVARDAGLQVHSGYFTESLLPEMGLFDVVVFADVLEHLAHPMALLELAMCALNSSGAVIVSVPNVAHWSVRLRLMRGRFEYERCGIMDATHVRWFTRAALRRFLERAGLHVEAMLPTAGKLLDLYGRLFPWRSMSPDRRAFLLRRLLRWKPELFACQWVARARLEPAGPGSSPREPARLSAS